MATWNIHGTNQHVALGELQQDTAVGGELDDGMMSFDNNAINSEEQSAALDHWVEAFEHEMTQHGDIDAAVAALDAAGCPDPMAVAEMYLHKEENPDTTEDLNETTPAEEPVMTPAPQEVAQGGQPLASTKTAASVAEFMSYLEQGSTPEALYAGFDQRAYPMIEEAIKRFQGGGQQAPAAAPQGAPAPNYDPNALNAEVSQSVQDMRGINQQRRAMQPPSSVEYNQGSPELQAITDQMRDMGYGGDADNIESEASYYDPEDLPMLIADAEELLGQMQAKDQMDEQYPEQGPVDQGSILPQGQSGNVDPMNADNFTPFQGKTADLAGSGPKRDKANEIYKAIRRDSDHDKSSAAAIANAEANDLEKKGDLALGNDDDDKKDDKKGNPFAKKDKGDDKDSDSKDDKDKDDKPDFLKKKDARASWNGLDGRIAAIFEGQWGDKLILLATEHGDITVPADEVGAPVGEVTGENPVGEINEFLSIIDPAGDVPATYHARIHNLGQVVREARKVITAGKISVADQVALDEIVINASAEIEGLRVLAEEYVSDDDQAYVDAQADNAYGIGAGGVIQQADLGHRSDGGWLEDTYHDMVSDTEATDFDRVVNEEPQLLVDDMPDSALADAGVMQQMALSHITPKTAMVPEPVRTEINTAFVAATEQARRVQLAARKSKLAKTAALLPDADGPAEGLFL